MGSDFSKYLFYILIVLTTFMVLLILIAKKSHKQNNTILIQKPIVSGNVSVFFDRDKNVTIIPYGKDKYGVGKAVGNPFLLKSPYNSKMLGAVTKDAMASCEKSKPYSDAALMSNLNFRGWKEFSEGKRNISAHYKEGHGVIFNTTRRRVDGSYQFNHFGFEKVLKSNLSDKELGEVLLELLQRCRS